MSGDIAQADIYRLAEMWVHDELTADEYFAEVDVRAREAVAREIAAEGLLRRARRHG